MKNYIIWSTFIVLALLGINYLYSFNDLELKEDLLEKIRSPQNYNGVTINSENILTLMPKTPQKIEDQVTQWLQKHTEISDIMSGDEYFEGDKPICTQNRPARQNYYDTIQKRIADQGYTNCSQWNSVIQLDDLYIKASGFPNRQQNIKSELGKGYNDPLTAEDFNTFKNQCGRTFQTISRAATYLRAIEAKKLFNLDINFPETFLVHIPGKPVIVADSNYVVVERKINNIIADLNNDKGALDEDIMKEMVMLIAYTGLWNHVGAKEANIVVAQDPTTGKRLIYYHDLEQPNSNRKPSNFFNKDTQNYTANIHHGWKAYESEIIKPYAEKSHISEETLALLLQKKQKLQERISPYLP